MSDDAVSNESKIRLRAAISSAYALVKGAADAVSLAEATPEQMMQERIDEIIGPSRNPRRPSQLESVQKIRADMKASIEQIRAMSPDELMFRTASDTEDSAISEPDPADVEELAE